jgi:hypothetical protein
METYETVFSVWFLCWIGHWTAVAALTSWFPFKHRRADPIVDGARIISLMYSSWTVYHATCLWWALPTHHDPHIFLPEVHFVLCVTLGYFLWDVMICVLFREKIGYDMLFHAVLCCSGFAISLQPFMMREAIAFLLFEWSTPLLQVFRLSQVYVRSMRCHLVSGFLFALAFFMFRIVWGTYLVFVHLLPLVYDFYVSRSEMSNLLALWATSAGLGSMALNYVWFRTICEVL